MADLTVEQFTDPFSPWCWAAEPTLRRLRFTFDDVDWTPRMTVLLTGGVGFPIEGEDAGARRDAWAAVAGASGMPAAVERWPTDPPSSRRACEAVALVREREPERAMAVLRALREAAFADGGPPADREAVAAVAGSVPGVAKAAIARGLAEGRGTVALRADLERAVAAADERDSVEVRGEVSTLPAGPRFDEIGGPGDPDGGDGTAEDAGSGDEEPDALLAPPALRVDADPVAFVDPRVSFNRLAAAFGRSVPRTGIEIDDKYATSRMAMHVPREVAESLSAQDFAAEIRPFLERFGAAYLPEVAAATGRSRDTCLETLLELADRGVVDRAQGGRWRTVDEAGGPPFVP